SGPDSDRAAHHHSLRAQHRDLSANHHCLRQGSFFFQAEDGIRDGHVTGVQTCALPISSTPRRRTSASSLATNVSEIFGKTRSTRSEERRVGKECRFRWLRYH